MDSVWSSSNSGLLHSGRDELFERDIAISFVEVIQKHNHNSFVDNSLKLARRAYEK